MELDSHHWGKSQSHNALGAVPSKEVAIITRSQSWFEWKQRVLPPGLPFVLCIIVKYGPRTCVILVSKKKKKKNHQKKGFSIASAICLWEEKQTKESGKVLNQLNFRRTKGNVSLLVSEGELQLSTNPPWEYLVWRNPGWLEKGAFIAAMRMPNVHVHPKLQKRFY